MSGQTVIDLDTFFNLNYVNLLEFCKDKNIQEDSINEVYVKLKTGVIPTGMTVMEYNSYIKKSLWNLMLDEKKSFRYRRFVDFPDQDKRDFELEKALNDAAANEADNQLYRDEMEWLSKKLFRFIEVKGFSEYEIFIFKSYFLVPKMTYSKLNNEIGIDMSKIQRTIRKFKYVIKNDFINWLKNNDG